jgi:hypothetical protein
MTTDLYLDQIMVNHPSRSWTKEFICSVESVLTKNNWICCVTNRHDYALYTNNNKKLLIKLAHSPDNDYDCDYFIGDAVTPRKEFQLYPEVYGTYHHEFYYQDHVPTKTFNCFINRGCGFRQSWFYFLTRKKLLDQGHVSFWCEDRFNSRSPQQHSEYLYQTYNREMFANEHTQMQKQIPYKNFNISVENAIIDSYKSLVIETYFEPNEYICYTEKIWRAIQLPRPVLLFSSQYAVRYLQEWGFDMFDDVIDHSYDREPNKFIRQQMLLDQLEKPIEYKPDIFEKRAQHNRDLLKYYQSQWSQKHKTILDAISTISCKDSC